MLPTLLRPCLTVATVIALAACEPASAPRSMGPLVPSDEGVVASVQAFSAACLVANPTTSTVRSVARARDYAFFDTVARVSGFGTKMVFEPMAGSYACGIQISGLESGDAVYQIVTRELRSKGYALGPGFGQRAETPTAVVRTGIATRDGRAYRVSVLSQRSTATRTGNVTEVDVGVTGALISPVPG